MQGTNHLLHDSHPDQEGTKGTLTGKNIKNWKLYFKWRKVNEAIGFFPPRSNNGISPSTFWRKNVWKQKNLLHFLILVPGLLFVTKKTFFPSRYSASKICRALFSFCPNFFRQNVPRNFPLSIRHRFIKRFMPHMV